MIEISEYIFGSDEYDQELVIRDSILRNPLGLKLSSKDCRADESAIHLGVFDDGILVGCLIIDEFDDLSCKIRQMALNESHRSRGIGRSLMEMAMNKCWSLGYNTITLNAREVALGFYEKCGFVVVSDRFVEVGIPHLRMEVRRGDKKT